MEILAKAWAALSLPFLVPFRAKGISVLAPPCCTSRPLFSGSWAIAWYTLKKETKFNNEFTIQILSICEHFSAPFVEHVNTWYILHADVFQERHVYLIHTIKAKYKWVRYVRSAVLVGSPFMWLWVDVEFRNRESSTVSFSERSGNNTSLERGLPVLGIKITFGIHILR